MAMQLLRERIAAIPNVIAEPRWMSRFSNSRWSARFSLCALLPQRPLLAGLFRYQSGHSRGLGRSGLPGADAGPECGGDAVSLSGCAEGSCLLLRASSFPQVLAVDQPRRRQISVVSAAWFIA
jgi:hypothetical protein